MSGSKTSVEWKWRHWPQMQREQQSITHALLLRADPEKLWMREELPPSGLTWMPDLESLTQMESELGELSRRFARQRVFLFLSTLGLVVTACIAIGLSIGRFLLTSG